MKFPGVYEGIDYVAEALEIVGVAVIALAFAHAMVRGFWHAGRRQKDAYSHLRHYMGRALLLGLEFLVAADVIRTVTIGLTLEAIMTLGILIVVRTILSWSITLEIEGCWPWQMAGKQNAAIHDR